MDKDFDKANKRYAYLKAKGFKTPAYRKAHESGGRFSRRGLTAAQKKAEYARVKRFLNAKTSTSRGAKKVYKDTMKRTGLDKLIDRASGVPNNAGVLLVKTKNHTDTSGNGTGRVAVTTEEVTEKFFDLASKVDEYLKRHKGVAISSGEVWGSIVDTYLSEYKDDIQGAVPPEELINKIIARLQLNYLESRSGFSEFK